MKVAVAGAVCCGWLATAFGAPNPPTAQDPMISITPVTRSMEQTGGSAAINTAGSGTWRASTSANWILLTSSSGTAGYPVGYTVGANNGVEARVGYVYVSGYVHTITQAGPGATLESYSAEFERAGGQGSVQVQAPSGKTWHAQSNVDWITVSTSSGTGTRTCSFTVAPYDEVSTRSGTLTIADNTFTVFQTGRRMQLKTTSATTDYFADTVKIRVLALADTAWNVTANASWLTVTDAGSGLGGDEVRVAVAENQSYNTRTGTVTIGTEAFTVTQLGRTALIFQIAPAEAGTFGAEGATGERIAVAATPDLGWTAAASADWIEISSGASGSGDGGIVYRVKPNPTLLPRAGAITVTAADGAVAPKRLDIAQEAATATLTVEEYEFEAAGETLTVGVNAGSIVEWGVTGLPAWLSVSAASSTGPANLALVAAANTSVQPRSATIRIADHEFRVSQKGRGVTVAYEPHVFDADGKATGENSDNPITVTADADVTWTAVASDDTWIIVYEGKTGQGNGTVRFIVAPYVGDGEVRTGLITIGSEIVYVAQRPYDLSIDPIGARVDGNAGAGEIQVALDIDGVWNAIATEPWIAIVSGYDAGTGNGKVLFSYTDNNTGRQRTGKIVIAGETYTLTQAARQLLAVSATVQGHGGHVAGGGTYGVGSWIALEAVPEPGDLVILEFAASESDPSRFDLLFGLDGIAVGSSAKPANLARTFAIEGAETLDGEFSEEAVALVSIGPSAGAIASSVEAESNAESFFFRVVERPLESSRYTISFDSAGGSAVPSITAAYGAAVTAPADPTKEGFTFDGWSPAFPATMPLGGAALVAQWTETTSNHFTWTVSENAVTITGVDGTPTGSLVIPAAIDGLPVTAIDWRAFQSCRELTSVSIPEGVTSIGNYAFQNCSELTAIALPNSVTNLGGTAFYGCSKLASISIPTGVTIIDGYTFYRCSRLASIAIPEGVTTIWHNAFQYCSGLTAIDLPDSMTTIGDYVFSYCSSLTSITIPDGVTSIGLSAFSGCSGLTALSLPGRFRGNTSNMGIPSGCTVTFRD